MIAQAIKATFPKKIALSAMKKNPTKVDANKINALIASPPRTVRATFLAVRPEKKGRTTNN